MNVLQVNKLYYPEVGGVEQVVQDIAEGLADSHTSRVLAARPRGLGRHEHHNGVEVTKTSSLGVVMSAPLAPTFPVHLRSTARAADIVHHHLPNPLSTVSQLTAGTGKAPVVATYHSDIVRQATAFRVYRPLLERFLDRVDRITVTSQRLLDNSDVLTPYTEKCEVVPLSVDLDAVDTEDPAELDVDTNGPIVLCVGRLNYYKGVEYLIDAMAEVEATLLVVGDGERRTALEQRARERGVTDRVRFLGYLPEPQLAGAYRVADLFVLPSIEPSEAFGIVQLEAMARETPVVNTSLPTGVPWVSQDRETGLTVPPRDVSAMADAITTLLDDDERRQRYAKRARERVEQHFTRDQMLAKVEEIYREELAAQ
ncbi:glycosyltransferase [Halorientalis marina]|uniref:glycosyltransferase n=1 Tax=Halorientalis marina TaxID=2931976 RepID=UPI001FF2BDFC|nr:glycosyltransferase [Halorientalis marina]